MARQLRMRSLHLDVAQALQVSWQSDSWTGIVENLAAGADVANLQKESSQLWIKFVKSHNAMPPDPVVSMALAVATLVCIDEKDLKCMLDVREE